MQTTDYRRYYVLYVDDEERSLKAFERAYGEDFRILTASNAVDGLKALETHADEVAVLMTDQRMPGEKGVWLLDKARQLRPNVLRILATAYSDMDAMIAAVNEGAIYQFVNKPWDPLHLQNTLKHALQMFSVRKQRDDLLREKMSVLQNMMVADRIVSLGFMAAGMSHHIRNSLVAVKTFIDLVPQHLRDEGIDPATSRNPEFWLDYQRSADEYIAKINDLLRELYAVAETPALAFTDRIQLREVVDETLASLRSALAAKRIVVEVQIPETFPVLTVDRSKFTRMIELLVKDELVSLPEDSRIVISAAVSNDKPDHVSISVRDNGPGLSQELLQSLFDPFSARSDSPSEHGINLMACYFIAHYHAGKIEARSSAGQGTEFIIDLPTSPNRPSVTEDRELFQRIRRADQMWEQLLSAT